MQAGETHVDIMCCNLVGNSYHCALHRAFTGSELQAAAAAAAVASAALSSVTSSAVRRCNAHCVAVDDVNEDNAADDNTAAAAAPCSPEPGHAGEGSEGGTMVQTSYKAATHTCG